MMCVMLMLLVLLWVYVLTRSISWDSTCMGSCCLLDPVWLNPLVEDVLHAAVFQDQSWQGV